MKIKGALVDHEIGYRIKPASKASNVPVLSHLRSNLFPSLIHHPNTVNQWPFYLQIPKPAPSMNPNDGGLRGDQYIHNL